MKITSNPTIAAIWQRFQPHVSSCLTLLVVMLAMTGCMDLGSLKEARQEAIAILDRAPAHAEAIILLADTAISEDDMRFTEQHLLNLKEPDRAALHVLMRDPTSIEARMLQAQACLAKGNTKKAVALLESLHTSFPKLPIPTYQLVELDIRDKNFAAAHQRVGVCLEKQPAVAGAHFLEGKVFAAQRDWDRAEAASLKSLELNPKLIAAVIKLARLHAGPLKNPDKALEFAKRARDLAPGDPRLAGILGALSYQAGDYRKAYDLLQESANGLPDDPGVLHDLAWSAYSQGKVEEAHKSMQQVLKCAPAPPQLADATSFLELIALDQGSQDLAASRPKIESVLQQNPRHVPALMARAALHAERAQTTPAAGVHAQVLAISPDFAPAQKWLTLVGQQPDNKKQTIESIQL